MIRSLIRHAKGSAKVVVLAAAAKVGYEVASRGVELVKDKLEEKRP